MMGRQYTSKRGQPVEFDLDRVHFVASGGMSMLELFEIARLADVDADSPEGMGALADFFRTMLGDDYGRFREHCRVHATDGDTLVQIMQDVMEAATDRPTVPPSDSASGQTSTGPTLRVRSPDGTWREETLSPERAAELRAAVDRAAG
jgi:hypothetical protein